MFYCYRQGFLTFHSTDWESAISKHQHNLHYSAEMELHLSAHGNGQGNFSGIALNGIEIGKTGYVVGDTEITFEDNSDYNIVNFVLEDGTRAMIVNGALTTADGQSLILQDDSDLSQYSFEDNAEEVVISKEQESQLLQIMTSQNNQNGTQSVIHYIQNDAAIKQQAEQQLLYVEESDNISPMHTQYQIAELDSLYSKETMQLINLENDQILQEVEGFIDLEELLLGQQNGLSVENGNCRYAILKDGQLHLQGINGSITSLNIEESEEESKVQTISRQDSTCNISNSLYFGSTKGRNIKTERKMNKSGKRVKNNILRSKRNANNAPLLTNLKKLINKKITIGQTAKGKTLVGKIINVMKKPDNLATEFKMTHSMRTYEIPKHRNPKVVVSNELLEGCTEEVIDGAHNKESSNQMSDKTWTSTRNSGLKNPKKLAQYPSNPSSTANRKDEGTKSPGLVNQRLSLKSTTVESKVILHNNPSKSRDDITEIPTTTPLPSCINSAIVKDSKSPKIYHQTREEPKVDNTDVSAKPSEHSKIIIHKKMVTKGGFDFIARTMSGLMNMESVVKKLENKTIIVKIIQKVYDQESCKYSKTISYCSGYMVREFKVDDIQNSFSESWSFISDNNSKETILAEYNLETSLQNATKMKKFANLTIQINIDAEGYRTTKVILNTPTLFQCKACSKSFRTSALLKMHSLSCSPPCHAQPVRNPIQMETLDPAEVAEDASENNKGIYECMECKQCFVTPVQIRKHTDMHYKTNMCHICKLKLSSVAERNRHMLTHSDTEKPPVLPISLEDEQEQNSQSDIKKRFNCHICSKGFSRHSNLQRHIEIHEGEGAMYQCAECNCCYHYVSSLTRHIMSCHVDKSKQVLQTNSAKESEALDYIRNQEKPSTVFQDEHITLDQMDEEYLQQYVTENFQFDNFQVKDATQILEIPINTSQIVEIPFDSNILVKEY